MAEEEEDLVGIEKLLADSNQNDVTLIADGLSKQFFIELDKFEKSKGDLYTAQLLRDEWESAAKIAQDEAANQEMEKSENQDEQEDIFGTEVNEKILIDARKRLESTVSASIHTFSNLFPINLIREARLKQSKESKMEKLKKSYLIQKPEEIKDELIERADKCYELSRVHYENGDYEETINSLNKAFNLNSFNIQFYLLKCEAFIQLCDFKSALITINKLLGLIAQWTDDEDTRYNELKSNMFNKIVFCYYALGQTNYDAKLYIEALDAFNKAAELKPENLTFKIRSVSCLVAMNKLNEALALLNKIITDNQNEEQNANLLVLRARLHLKNNNQILCFYDVRDALLIQMDHVEGRRLMQHIEDNAEQLRNQSLILSLNNRASDALAKITSAISLNPEKAEYHLQRGIIYKRLKDFNSSIDDFLLGIDKLSHEKTQDPELFANFQRQILLTYNEFAIHCYQKKFYDDAIVLLNKAIKLEKNEKGFYVNRGDCFLKKKEIKFALLDYEQAVEIDPTDEDILNRIAKIHYKFGVDAYDEKNFKEARNSFDVAVKNSPKTCKYYIARARASFFMEDNEAAKLDICVSILLDPANSEIPSIISRIFANQSLSDVFLSEEMEKARDYLDELNIKSILNLNRDNVNESLEYFNRKSSISLLNESPKAAKPNLDDFKKEEELSLKLIEEKKAINKCLKETEHVSLKSDRQKLAPLSSGLLKTNEFDKKAKRLPNEIRWRKFNTGIGSSL